MKMIQFKDELVALKQCKIGTILGYESFDGGISPCWITGFVNFTDVFKITIKMPENVLRYTGEFSLSPEHLIWNI